MIKYGRIVKPIYCGGVAVGFGKYAVSEGDIVTTVYGSGTGICRVLGTVTYLHGEKIKARTMLACLQLGESLTHAFVRPVNVCDVQQVQLLSRVAEMLRTFLAPTMPAIETLDAASHYGALSSGRVGQIVNPDGSLSEDWRARIEAMHARDSAHLDPSRH